MNMNTPLETHQSGITGLVQRLTMAGSGGGGGDGPKQPLALLLPLVTEYRAWIMLPARQSMGTKDHIPPSKFACPFLWIISDPFIGAV
jgi:hypothetical protein